MFGNGRRQCSRLMHMPHCMQPPNASCCPRLQPALSVSPQVQPPTSADPPCSTPVCAAACVRLSLRHQFIHPIRYCKNLPAGVIAMNDTLPAEALDDVQSVEEIKRIVEEARALGTGTYGAGAGPETDDYIDDAVDAYEPSLDYSDDK